MGAPVNDLLTTGALSVLLVSFGVGIVVGLTGMGGGALMTPALIFLGVNPTVAVANDLVAASVNKSVGAAVHWKFGRPNIRLAGLLMCASVPTAFAGAFIVKAVGDVEQQEAFLKQALGFALLFTAGTYALRMYLQLRYVTGGNTLPDDEPKLRPAPTLLVGAVGGLLVGITSVGSGSLIMVALLLLYPTLSAVRLVGTDLVQAVPLVLSAAISHVLVSGVEWAVLIPLILGGSPGTFLGARLANWVAQSVIRRGIVIVLSLTGLNMLGVPPEIIGLIGAGMLLLGPLVWGFIRQTRGLPAFDNNAAAWRPADRADRGQVRRAPRWLRCRRQPRRWSSLSRPFSRARTRRRPAPPRTTAAARPARPRPGSAPARPCRRAAAPEAARPVPSSASRCRSRGPAGARRARGRAHRGPSRGTG